jgi:hypothetical protein
METTMATGAEKFGGLGSVGGSGATGQAARTYNDMLGERGLTPSDEQRIKADAILGVSAALLQQRGHQDIALLLLDVIQPVIEPTDDRFNPDDLWFEVEPEHIAGFEGNTVEKIREACHEVCRRRGYDIYFEGVREILPDVGPEWRENLRQHSVGGKRPTNHARRVRIESSRPREDHLAFTNEGELAVYRTLRKIQEGYPLDETIGIFPCRAAGSLTGRGSPTSSLPTGIGPGS